MSDTSTVLAGGLEISSNHEQAADMVSVLSRPKESAEPRILIEKGKEVDAEREEEIKVSEAAAALGKKGGKAAAEKKAEQKTQGLVDEYPEEETETEEKPEKEESPEEKDAEAKKEALGKPKHDLRARMLAATSKEGIARREAEKAKEEAAALRAERDALKARLEPKEPPKPVEAPTKPVRASYASDDDYFEALADFKADEKVKAYEQKRETETRVKEYTSTLDAILGKHATIEKEYAKTDPDYLTKISEEVKAVALKPSFALDLHEVPNADNVIADELLSAEKMAPVLKLHFSEHPEDFQRIRALSSWQEVQVEMRLLARTLNGVAAMGSTPKGSSKAKPPVQPVTGSPVASEPDIFGDIDFDTFAQRRLKKKA
jgi:hypothetical protein